MKSKIMTLLLSVSCLFACIGASFLFVDSFESKKQVNAATTEELTAEFTNNGQFTIGQFKEGMSHEVLDSTADGVPAGAEGAVLKITGTGDDGTTSGGAFVTLDFSANKMLRTGVDIVVRVYQPDTKNFRVSRTAGSDGWTTQTTLAAGWNEVTLSATNNAGEDHQLLTTLSMGFRRGTECYIDSIKVVDSALKQDFTNNGQFNVEPYIVESDTATTIYRALYVDGAAEGLPEGYDGAALKLWTGATQYAVLNFSGSGLKATDVASITAKCYLPYADATSDGSTTYTDSNYEFRLNNGENTAGGAGAYDMSTWFEAPINVSKIATDVNGFLTTVTVGLRNKGNTASYFYIDDINVELVEYTTVQVGKVETYGTNATHATRLYFKPTDQTVEWYASNVNFTWHSGLGFEQVRNGEVIYSGHLTISNRNSNLGKASNVKLFYVDISPLTREAGDIFRIGGTYCNTTAMMKYVIEDSEVLWDGTSFGKDAEYTTLEMGKLTVRSVSNSSRIYGTPDNYTLANMPHKSWDDAFYLYSGDGMKINGESTAIGSMHSTGEGVTFTFPAVSEVGTVISISGTFRCPVQKLEYVIDESKFVWNGTAWEEYVEYTTYEVGDVKFHQVGGAGNRYVYLMPVSSAGFDTTTWNSGWGETFSWKNGVGVTLNGNDVGAVVKFPGSIFIDLGAAPAVGDILCVGGTFYNVNVAKEYNINEATFVYNGTDWENYVEYAIHELGTLKVHVYSNGTTTNPPSKTAIYLAQKDSSIELPFTSWDDKFNLESGDGWKLNGETITTGWIVSVAKAQLYVSLADANVQVGDVLSVSGTFVHVTELAKYVIEESKFVWDGVAWENYEDYTKEYTTQEVGSLKFSSWTAGNNYITLARADGGGFTIPADNNSGWTAVFRAKLGVGVTLNGKLLKNHANQIKFPGGNMFINITNAFEEGEGPVEGDVLTVGGTFYNIDLAMQYVVSETSFTWNGTTWEKVINYATYTVTKVGIAGGSTASVLNLYTLEGDALPKDKGDWVNVYSYADGASVKLNDTEITAEIKMPGDLYVPLNQDAQVGDCFTINGTFYNAAKEVKLVFVDCKLYWDGSAWVESYEEPPVVEYAIHELGTLTVHSNSTGATSNVPKATQLYMKVEEGEAPAYPDDGNGGWNTPFVLVSGDGVKVNGNVATVGKFFNTNAGLFVELGAAGVQTGDVLSLSGTFANESALTKYVVEESKFIWNGSVWAKYIEYTTYELNVMKFQQVGGENKQAYFIREDGETIHNSEWVAFTLEVGVGVTINDEEANATVKFPSAFFIEFATAPTAGDKLTFGGIFYNEDLATKYVVPESTFWWDGSAWSAEEYVILYTEHNLGAMLVASPSASVSANAKATQLYLKQASGAALPYPDESWNTEFAYESGAGVCLNGEQITISDLESTNSGLFLSLTNAGITAGDVLTIGGSYTSMDVTARYIITESAFMWNGTFWVNYQTNDKLEAYDIITIQDIGFGSEVTWEGTVSEVQHEFARSVENTTNSLAIRFGYNCADTALEGANLRFRLRGSNWTGITFDFRDGKVYIQHLASTQSYALASNTNYVIEIGAISMKDSKIWTYVKVDEAMVLSATMTSAQFMPTYFDDYETSGFTTHVSIYAQAIAKTTLTDPDGIAVKYVSSAGTYVEKVRKDQVHTLATGKGLKTFIGWVAEDGTFYEAGEEYGVVESTITFTALEIDFTMEEGAAIRLGTTADYSGIRFTSKINEDDIDALFESFVLDNFAYGTLIMPYDYLEYGQKPNLDDFVVDTDVLKIESTNEESKDGYTTIRGAMQKIYEGNYGRLFAGRGYIEITINDKALTVYTPFSYEENVRSIRMVAKAFKEDTSEPESENDLRYATITDEQKAIVEAYIVEDEIRLMNYAAYEANAMPIIAWNYPALDSSNNYNNDANIAVANTMKEAGIKVIGLTGANILKMDTAAKIEQTRQIINFLWSQGIGTFAFQNNGGNSFNINFTQTGYPDFSDCEGFMGFLAWDEPSVASIETIATQVAAFEAAYAGTDVTFMGNLLPSYASIFNTDDVVDKAAFKAYLQKYCDDVLSQVSGTKWLSLDTYPILADQTLVKNFLYDIGALKTVALENDAHAHVILQSYGYVENGNTAKERMPSEAELRMQAYTAMAFGVDSMSWYVYSPNGHGESDTAADVNGAIANQDNYNAFKNINTELAAIGSVYNTFDWKGIILGAGKDNGMKIGSWEISKDNDYKAFEMVMGQLGDYELSASDTKHLSSVKTNKTDWNYLMGVMEDVNGNEGYVLCNYNSHESDRAQTITLTFDSNITEVVIYRGGVAETVSVANKTLAVSLATGEGVIVLPSKLN